MTTIKAGSGGTAKALRLGLFAAGAVALAASNTKAAPLVVAILAAAIVYQVLTIQVVK